MGTLLNMSFKNKTFFKLLLVSLLLSLYSCNTTRQLKENEYLVTDISLKGDLKNKVDKHDIEPYIRQKPNRKILSVLPFNLWLYTKINKEKMVRKKEKRDTRFDRINEKRVAKNKIKNEKRRKKGKRSKEPRLKNKDKPTFRESLLEIAEEPVIYDSAVTKQSSSQIKRYLFSKGFFYAQVDDSVTFIKRKKKAQVDYHVVPGPRYYINNITYTFPEEELAYYVNRDTVNSKLKRGEPYDADIMQLERERITVQLMDNGYYFFEQDYVFFEVDSTIGNKKLNINVSFKKFPAFIDQNKDSVSYVKHPRYYVNNIYIITENLKSSYKDEYFKDTIAYEDYKFLLKGPLKFRRSVIGHSIEFFKGQIFQKTLAEKTYKRLLNLGVFRTVVIQYVKNPYHNDQLDCYIICQPVIKQSITIETEGTNTSGNLGIDGSLLFQNKNLLKGAELFELSLNGAIIAQRQFNTGQSDIKNVSNTFNTIQFGPSMRFSVPRAAFPFSLFPFKKDAFPRTYINTSLNYQRRPEFNRIITNINYGFSFKTRKTKWKHDLVPFEAYMVKANLLQSFRDELIKLNDLFLLNSFQDHITTLSRYTVAYNNQIQTGINNTSRKPVSYVKINLASSGNVLRGVYQLTDAKQDTLGRYLITGIPFAQFVKMDIDYRLYIPIRKKNRAVYRTMIGVGKPLRNLNVLPYEQSYFSGGPNSVRAWRARTLGPGGYDPTNTNSKYDKIGDLIIEGNIEYRFHLFRSFYGAWFVDAGNIWLLHKDATKPGGEFDITRFYKEIAVGMGWGLRWDLNFFVLRLDAAAPIVDPKYAEGDRWTFDKKPLRQITLNFGIGYPF